MTSDMLLSLPRNGIRSYLRGLHEPLIPARRTEDGGFGINIMVNNLTPPYPIILLASDLSCGFDVDVV